MRDLLVLCSALLLADFAAAQALSEPFDTSATGVFPPALWSETNTATGELWEDATNGNLSALNVDAAYHDYHFQSSVNCDDMLITPTLDLSTYRDPRLVFDSQVRWTAWMAHYPNANSNGASNVEVSTDGGVTWQSVWQETAAVDGYYPDQTVDLIAYANLAAVEMRFHYFGNNAHEWAVDNVVVDHVTPIGPTLTVVSSCPGTMSLDAGNMAPGSLAGFVVSFSTGSFMVPSGVCSGLMIGLSNPVLLAVKTAGPGGHASVGQFVTGFYCGNVSAIVVDGATCLASNIVVI